MQNLKKLLKWITFSFIAFCIVISIIGCGGGGPSGKTSGKYTIRVGMTTGGFTQIKKSNWPDILSSKVYAASNLPDKNSSWFLTQPTNEYYAYVQWTGTQFYGQGACWAEVYDSDGNVVPLTDEQKQNITWSCSDSSIVFNVSTGIAATITAYGSKAITLTAAYEGCSGTAKVVFVKQASNSTTGSATSSYGVGYIFASDTMTTDTSTADFYYTLSGGVWYLCAPGGIAQILDREFYTDGSGNVTILPSVLKVPDGLTYSTQIAAVYYGTFIIKDRNGTGYTKVQCALDSNPASVGGNAANFWYEHTDSSKVFKLIY